MYDASFLTLLWCGPLLLVDRLLVRSAVIYLD
jgi:hypothetical protein